MINKIVIVVLCFFEVIIISACSSQIQDKQVPAEQNDTLPFNYNVPDIYVFSIKVTSSNDTFLYADTLGLMCTNKIANLELGLTVSSWLYLSKSAKGAYILNPAKINNSRSGTLCNNDTLFVHPPREGKYTILQICPYPFLMFPLQIGRKWNWNLTVGGQWSPGGSIKWDGDEDFKAKYEVTDTTTLELPIGKISCYHIHAIGTSKFGTSSADFYYSYKYGIVRLFYRPLDKTKIEFNFIAATNDPILFKAIIFGYQDHQEYLNFIEKISDLH